MCIFNLNQEFESWFLKTNEMKREEKDNEEISVANIEGIVVVWVVDDVTEVNRHAAEV